MTNAATEAQNKTISRTFWAIIFFLAFSTIALSLIGVLRAPEKTTSAPVEIDNTVLGKVFSEGAKQALAVTDSKISSYLDKAYAPVYAAIPDYTSFHYSVLGEYTELLQVVMGNMVDVLTKKLFKGFNERFQNAVQNLDQEFVSSYIKTVQTEVQKAIPSDAFNTLLGPVTQSAIKEVEHRAIITVPLATLAAATVTSGALRAVTVTIAIKIATKVAAMAAAKGFVKGTGVLTGAGGGALLCSWAGPGAVVCAAAGAATAWFLTDAVVVNLDEYYSRKDFEVELRKMVDEDRAAKRQFLEGLLVKKASKMDDYAKGFTVRSLGTSK